MFTQKFLTRQQKRIEQRIERCKNVIRIGRIDNALKSQKILPAQQLALLQLKRGFYGYCTDCGVSIPLKRLEKVPAALRCVMCQKMSEQK